MKLKLNTNQSNNASPSQPESAVTAAAKTPGLKLSFAPTPTTTSQPTPSPQQQKPKPARGKKGGAGSKPEGSTTPKAPKSKKRAREDDDDNNDSATPTASATKKQARQGSISLKVGAQQQGRQKQHQQQQQRNIQPPPKPLHIRTQSIKLSSANKTPTASSSSLLTPKTPTGPTRLRINKKGAKPPRPPGVGYDSEASDAEDDPALEENMILRMAPEPDASYVRRAIEERTMGVPVAQGGAEVSMRFFASAGAREARRAAVTVQDRVYGAVLVDLPCVVESLKSWDRRGWWKSADVCQMWVVTGRVGREEEALEGGLPRGVDAKTMQWPHGLTPPMHNVRRRRFRKRVSYRTIEAAEDEVERLLGLDKEAKRGRGRTEYEVLDLQALKAAEEEEEEEEEEEGAEGAEEYEEQDGDVAMSDANGEQAGDEYFDEEDAEDVAARMALELGADTASVQVAQPPATTGEPSVMLNNPADAAAAMTPTLAPQPSTAPPGAEEEESDEDAEEEEEDDAEEEEDEANESEREKAQMRAQQREEVAHLQREVDTTRAQLAGTANPLVRSRYQKRIESLEKDLANKKRNLGEDEE